MPPARPRPVDLAVLAAGAFSSIILAFSTTPAFATLAASIRGFASGAGTGTLVMQESTPDGSINCSSLDGGSISNNASTCATISKYGGGAPLVPGRTTTQTVRLTNVGTVPASAFTLAAGACRQEVSDAIHGTAVDLCERIQLRISSGTVMVFAGTPSELDGKTLNLLAALDLPAVAGGQTVPVTATVTLDETAGNDYQGLRVAQSLEWTFQA